ncbi:protein rep, partial [Candidatus Dojkabacteria bacterium]|nr:protein rep [Candidatus Dojkabacteria bacterium]
TLAQNRTISFDGLINNEVVFGNGTPMENNPSILKRANKKAITNALVLAMVDIANEKGEFERAKKYWNTFHCQNKLISHNGRYYTDYCKNRWCATCCGIRKAFILNRYYPIIINWEEPHLLTLTIKAIKAEDLHNKINEVINNFSKIRDRCNKRHQRGKGMKVIFIKSLECNFNATKRTYNPHYHIITPNRETALYLKQEWIKECNKTSFNAGNNAQHLIKIEDVEKGLVEVIKYGAKILSDPDPTHKRKRNRGDMVGLKVYARALHNIYNAMNNHRLYGSIGFKLPEVENENISFKYVSNYESWTYQPQQMDWINNETEKKFTEYEIDSYLEYILKTCMDKETF